MPNYSLTYVGVIVVILSQILKASGLEIADETLTVTVTTGLTLLGAALSAFGRWRKGDLHWSGMKKEGEF